MGNGTNLDPVFSVLSFLDRPTQFIVIRVGNTSTNSAPILSLPTDPVIITEDSGVTEYQLEYTDAELDLVDFYLNSVPRLGNASLSVDGLLHYEPCSNCIGVDYLDIYIVERSFGVTHIPLTATGRLFAEIQNANDPPEVYFYHDDTSNNQVTLNHNTTSYIDANRTIPAVAAQIACLDFDGYHDDLEIFVQDGLHGTAGYQISLDIVNVPESLPISFSDGEHAIESYSNYITFVRAYITYLPSDSSFTGEDDILILVQDSDRVQSAMLSLHVEVLPSLCENNGVCGGSEMDPTCTDISARRAGFDGYNCSCPTGFGGSRCEISTSTPAPEIVRGNIYKVF